jgi:ABC-type transport system involved in cytochrome c biogenesis permease subunit
VHYWYAIVGAYLLAVGIITGSMWGAASWGRYWGWDPKEVWSLVALLGYMAILHVRVDQERTPSWVYGLGAVLALTVFALVMRHFTPLSPTTLGVFAVTAVASLVFVLARGPFATGLKSILAFWLIIMTYVGVNYVLGIGLHSYAFGKGAVVRYMFLLGGIDLALIAVCTLVYVVRRQFTSAGPAAPVAASVNPQG